MTPNEISFLMYGFAFGAVFGLFLAAVVQWGMDR